MGRGRGLGEVGLVGRMVVVLAEWKEWVGLAVEAMEVADLAVEAMATEARMEVACSAKRFRNTLHSHTLQL